MASDTMTCNHEMTIETKSDAYGQLLRWACTCGRAAGVWLRPTHWREDRAERCHWYHVERIERAMARPANITAQMNKLTDVFARLTPA